MAMRRIPSKAANHVGHPARHRRLRWLPLLRSRRLQARRPQLHAAQLTPRPRLTRRRAHPPCVPPPNPAGGGWQPATPSDGMLRGKWWEIYHDPQLNKLEERIRRTTRACARRSRPIWPRATRSRWPAPTSIPRSPPGPASRTRKSRRIGRLRQPDGHTSYNDLTLTARPAGSRTSGAASAAPSRPPATTRRPAPPTWPRRPQPASRDGDRLLRAARPRLPDQAAHATRQADLESQLDLTQRLLTGGVATDVDVAQAQTAA